MCSVSTSGSRNSARHVVQIRLSLFKKKKKREWRGAVTLCAVAGIALRRFFNIRTTLRQHWLDTVLFTNHEVTKAAIL